MRGLKTHILTVFENQPQRSHLNKLAIQTKYILYKLTVSQETLDVVYETLLYISVIFFNFL